MKTAMQEAIEYLRMYNILSAATILEDNFIEIEKQQIIDAFNDGKGEGAASASNFERGIEYEDKTGEQYYNETFKQ